MYYKPLLLPLLIQVFLTFLVWFRMYYQRINEMKEKNIEPQELATREKGRQLMIDSAASSDNLRNQFEMPVLFYLAIVLALNLMWQDPMLVTFAWLFVAFRTAHAIVHTTYNAVMHRFWMYLFSCFALLGMWARLGWYIISV